jgi:ribA/ribD-fused uncharacterized protein
MKTIARFDGEHSFLSNFHPSIVAIGGYMFPTAEHAFQAMKTADRGWQQQILRAETPGRAKRLGRSAPLRHDWDVARIPVMVEVVRRKFGQNVDLGGALLATGDARLVEGNTWGDTFWGVCNGRGENRLGLALMLVRNEMRRARGLEATTEY